jgi:hypothetical protein
MIRKIMAFYLALGLVKEIHDGADIGLACVPVPDLCGEELSECRDAQDAKRDIQVALSPSLVTTAY